MKKGTIVNVWLDPITRKKFEGRARLVKKLHVGCSTGQEYWTVRFHNGEVSDRFVTIGDTDTEAANREIAK